MSFRPGIQLWALRGIWGILEHGVFAVAHMLTNVLLARWLSDADFGRFALLYPFIILLSYVQSALITEPLLVYARKTSTPEEHVSGALRLQLYASGPLSVVILGAGGVIWLVGSAKIAFVVFGFAVAAPCALLLGTARKASFALLKPHISALAGGSYLLLVSALLVCMRVCGRLSPASVYFAIGLVDLAFFAVLSRLLPRCVSSTFSILQQASEYWRFGRWLLWMAPLRWAPLNVFFLSMPLLMINGTIAVGVLRATLIVVAPIQHIQMALASLLVPAVSERIHRGLAVPRGRLIIILLAMSIIYFSVLVAFGDNLMALLYGGTVKAPSGLPAVLGAIPVVTAVIMVTQAELMASIRLRAVFASYLAGTLVSVTLGFVLIDAIGVLGAAWGALAAYCTILAVQSVAQGSRSRSGVC